jgi:hypothetical protein
MKLLPDTRYLHTAYLFIIKTGIDLKNYNGGIKLKAMDNRTLSICFRKGNSGEIEKS